MTPETNDDWGTCVATGVVKMDPYRGRSVLARLLKLCVPPAAAPTDPDPDPDQATTFVVCARLYALQVTTNPATPLVDRLKTTLTRTSPGDGAR